MEGATLPVVEIESVEAPCVADDNSVDSVNRVVPEVVDSGTKVFVPSVVGIAEDVVEAVGTEVVKISDSVVG